MDIEKEVSKAYADCWGQKNFTETEYTRNLNFRASSPVSREEAFNLLEKYVPGGYNAFVPKMVNKLPIDSSITIAREGSVCLYVSSNELNKSQELLDKLQKFLEADEFDYYEDKNEYRIWWD